MKILAFIRISDGRIFHQTENGEYTIEGPACSYTEKRLSIKEFLPIFQEEQIDFYSDYFKHCDKNSDYIPECEVCGMSYYTCLCSHDD